MNVNVLFSFVFAILSVVSSETTLLPYRTVPDKDAEPYKDIPARPIDPKENDVSYWQNQALDTLKEKVQKKLNTNKAKNVIFFLGDGLSVTTVTAARIYKGQLQNRLGEEEKLFMETFPYTGLSKTYCIDKQVSDSAATATAYMSGVKANFQTIGVSGKVHVADCESAKVEANRPASITKWAQDAGKSTGVVTTARVTHASPAGSYAHIPFRDLESDQDVVNNRLNTTSCNFDIAKQLVFEEPGRHINVVMGGGAIKLLPKNDTSPNGKGERIDQDLVEAWKKDKESRNLKAAYVKDVDELNTVDISSTDYLLGLFASGHMAYHSENQTQQPTLEEMTEKAIKLLEKNSNGFYLFVEGARIDMAHHEDEAHKALDETIEFDKAIKKAYELTNAEDTLIVVTADHAHTMSMSGYPDRGNDINGLFGKGSDNLAYSTLSYANGPGYKAESSGARYNLAKDEDAMHSFNYIYPATVPKAYESHGGDDVSVYASGPWAHLFSGNYEQNYLPIAEAFAAQIGPAKDVERPKQSNSAAAFGRNSNFVFYSIILSLIRWLNL